MGWLWLLNIKESNPRKMGWDTWFSKYCFKAGRVWYTRRRLKKGHAQTARKTKARGNNVRSER